MMTLLDNEIRRQLSFSLCELLQLNYVGRVSLYKRLKKIKSNQELLNSVPEIIKAYTND